MQTVYECLKNWMDDYNRNIMITTFMTSEEKEQIKIFSDRLMQAYELYVDNRYIEAFNIFNQAMDSAKNHLPTTPVGQSSAYKRIKNTNSLLLILEYNAFILQ